MMVKWELWQAQKETQTWSNGASVARFEQLHLLFHILKAGRQLFVHSVPYSDLQLEVARGKVSSWQQQRSQPLAEACVTSGKLLACIQWLRPQTLRSCTGVSFGFGIKKSKTAHDQRCSPCWDIFWVQLLTYLSIYSDTVRKENSVGSQCTRCWKHAPSLWNTVVCLREILRIPWHSAFLYTVCKSFV